MDILFYGEKEKQFYFLPYAQSKNLDCRCNNIVTFNIDTAAAEIIAESPDELIIDADCIVDDGACASKIADIKEAEEEKKEAARVKEAETKLARRKVNIAKNKQT